MPLNNNYSTLCFNCPNSKCLYPGLKPNNQKLSTLRKHLVSSVKKLYANDYHLISNMVNEVDIVAHIWYYFKSNYASNYQGYDIDIEYNRCGNDPKGIYYDKYEIRNTRPDFIIHKRGCNKYNFAVMEFKCYWNYEDRNEDYNKLIHFTNNISYNNDFQKLYNYTHGIFVELLKSSFKIKWFKNGSEYSGYNAEYSIGD